MLSDDQLWTVTRLDEEMISEPVIREANDEDAELLSRLIRQSYHGVALRFGLNADNCPKHPSNCTTAWIQRDYARDVRYFILEHGGTAVGCSAMEMAQEGSCYLERLSVLPPQRQKGYGLALVAHVITKAKMRGANRVGIGIIADQTELKQWYQKIGFVEGETKAFDHLPFGVTFLTYDLSDHHLSIGPA
jgi:N-acetylglutamate synthase-like GNAT family acetyltransferase